MTYTPSIERAIQKASILHDGQKRKGEEAAPYVSHLFSVAAILSNYTKDEDTLIAGLLHDSIEDTDYTEKDLRADFGVDVACIVMGVTEQKERDGFKLLWKDRKDVYLELLGSSNEKSLMVSAADKIHNLQSAIQDRESTGENFWSHRDYGTTDDQLWFFGQTLVILKERLHNEIVTELEDLLAKANKIFQKKMSE